MLKFESFVFESDEYTQHSGLAMGSPLSPVAACLYMEWLEQNRYRSIMGDDVLWLRYVDDVIVAPKSMNLREKLTELNAVEPRIQFTLEEEEQARFPF